MHQVYVIQNPKDRFYIGISENVEKRLRQHNNGESKWTSDLPRRNRTEMEAMFFPTPDTQPTCA